MSTTNVKHPFFYRNGLSIVFLSLFLISLIAQGIAGFNEHNAERKQDHASEISFVSYLQSGHFISATFENLES